MGINIKPAASKGRRGIKGEAVFGLCAALIPLIGWVLFSLAPIGISFATMFVDMQGYRLETMEWNHFANFKTVFCDAKFWLSFRITVLLLLVQVVSLLVALITSTILAQNLKGTKGFAALFFVPYICSSVAITIIWMTMFDNNYGIINDILVRLFGEGGRVEWYNRAIPYFFMMFIIMAWQAPGYGIVMYKAAFTAVPGELYEAARVDGANKWEQFWHVTLPTIRPTTFFLVMAGIISGMQVFDIPMLLSQALGNSWIGAAGPDDAGLTTMLYIYNKGIMFNNMPEAAVMSFLLFLIIAALTVLNFQVKKRAEL